MKNTELRIGNKICADGTDVVFTVNKISKKKINGNLTYDRVNPIPLTEKWLIKFGFYKSNKLFYSIQAGQFFEISICVKKGPSGCFRSVAFESLEFEKALGHMLGKCEYVHQVQNLYFALTGEELTLKEEVKP